MSEKSRGINRRDALKIGLSAAAASISGLKSEARQREAINLSRSIRAYERAIKEHKELFEKGPPEEIIRFLMTETRKGKRPKIYPYNSNEGKYAYPGQVMTYKGAKDTSGWPTALMYMRPVLTESKEVGSEQEPIATNAIRIGENRFLIPGSVFWRATGTKPEDINLRSVTLSPKGEHTEVPILEPLPAVSDKDIKDGTYAVALGKSNPLEWIENGDLDFGGYYLTGFLMQISDKPALRSMFETTSRKQGLSEESITGLMNVVDDSYAMIGDMTEARELNQRMLDGQDGLGQRVYVNLDGKGFKRAGIVHHAIFITPDGSPYDGKISSPAIPVYLVYGLSSIKRALK